MNQKLVDLFKRALELAKTNPDAFVKSDKWSVHVYHRAEDHFNDPGTWEHHSSHSNEHEASVKARDLYQRGAYNVKVKGPDGKESSKWASKEYAKSEDVSKADEMPAPNLGTTRSGKTIHYDIEHPSHEGWSADDHADAAQAFAAKAKMTADQAFAMRDRNAGLEANKLLARARHHADRKRHIEWLAEHNAKEKAKLEPKGFVHVHQHASAIRNNNPNPVQGHPKSLDDLTRLAEYHGRPQHEFSDKPDKRFGYSTYQVNPDKSLAFLHGDYDTSD